MYRTRKVATGLAAIAAGLLMTTQTALSNGTTVPDWTGFYIGGFVGGGAVNNDIDVDIPQLIGLDFDGVGGEGFVGGGFLGFNYQVSPRFVLGIQGEIGVQDLETEASVGPFDLEAAPDFNAAISGRAGWLANPNTMLYIIGGYSYAEYDVELSLAGLGSADFDEKYHGFHIGAGIEARLTQSITARIEYRYTEYGDEDWGTGGIIEVEPSTHTGTLGVAWNFYTGGDTLITPAADYIRPEEPVAETTWSGVYLGGFIGGGAIVNEIDVGGLNFDGVGGEGFVGGGFLGVNYQVGSNFVIGAQVELGVADLQTDFNTNVLGGIDVDAAPDFNLAVSGRLGYLADPDTLLYVIGGYSYAEYEVDISIGGGSADFDEKYNGFHVGGGIETRLTESLTARVEYRYTQYGDEDWGTGGVIDVEPSSHVGTVGLAWNFFGLL
ncbi:MAG: outer membrane protein [Hyphomicrobiales bacterium]